MRQELSGSPSFRVSPSARATLLDPGKPSSSLPVAEDSVLDAASKRASPLASELFEAVWLKPDAGPACGSRFSRDTLLDGRSRRKYHRSTPIFFSGTPSAEQSSVLGCWLDFSIHRLTLNSSSSAAGLEGLPPSDAHGFPKRNVEVGAPVARCPPHRSRRAVFKHRALQINSLSHGLWGGPAATTAAADRN